MKTGLSSHHFLGLGLHDRCGYSGPPAGESPRQTFWASLLSPQDRTLKQKDCHSANLGHTWAAGDGGTIGGKKRMRARCMGWVTE